MGRNEWIGRHWMSGKCVCLRVREGRVLTIRDVPNCETENWISPGLIDLQINGIHQIDFNDPTLSIDQIGRAVRYLHTIGVVRFCPTIGTNTRKNMNHCMRNIAEACEADPVVAGSVLGIHVEGPFISDQDGPRGAHSKSCVRDPDWNEFLEWEQASGRRIVKVTLAPERQGALRFIRRLKRRGVVVAIGHTSAVEKDILQAVEAGASMSTHLGNGAHPLIRRHPNYIWDQLANDQLWAGLIADGHHLPPSTLKSMIRMKQNKAILVSDANHYEGFPPGKYLKRKRQEVVLREDGRLYVAQSPDILSGAALGLHRGIENVVKFGICHFGEAIQMATLHPAELMGIDGDGIVVLREGSPADFIKYRTNDKHGFHIVETVKAGESVYTDGKIKE